jgi:hypothetical protein
MVGLESVADLLGLTTQQLTTVIVLGIAVIAGWYALRVVLRIARKVFSIGCLGIIILLAILYITLVIMGASQR